MAVSVVLAEDTFIVREGVQMLLEQGGYDLKAAVEDYPELKTAVEEHSPDVVITDIRMPPTRTDEGVRAAREIRESRAEPVSVQRSQGIWRGRFQAAPPHHSSREVGPDRYHRRR